MMVQKQLLEGLMYAIYSIGAFQQVKQKWWRSGKCDSKWVGSLKGVRLEEKWEVVKKVGREFNEEVGEKWLVVVIVDVVAKAGGKFRMEVVVQVEEFMAEIQSLEWKWWRNGKWQIYAHFHSAHKPILFPPFQYHFPNMHKPTPSQSLYHYHHPEPSPNHLNIAACYY
jgi:hypothetical protein